MDVKENITNIRKRMVAIEVEANRLAGMLEVFETMDKMGVVTVKPTGEEDKSELKESDEEKVEEVLDVLEEEN